MNKIRPNFPYKASFMCLFNTWVCVLRSSLVPFKTFKKLSSKEVTKYHITFSREFKLIYTEITYLSTYVHVPRFVNGYCSIE